jgi:serine/threonine protein kinase
VLHDVLGEGGMGIVRLGVHETNPAFRVAIKTVRKQQLDEKSSRWEKVKREIAILKLIDHPNVLKLFDVLETSSKLHLVLENVEGGELFDYILANGRLDEMEALRLFAQIVSGLVRSALMPFSRDDVQQTCLLIRLDLRKGRLCV